MSWSETVDREIAERRAELLDESLEQGARAANDARGAGIVLFESHPWLCLALSVTLGASGALLVKNPRARRVALVALRGLKRWSGLALSVGVGLVGRAMRATSGAGAPA